MEEFSNEELLEQLYWDFVEERKKGNLSERNIFKCKMRYFAKNEKAQHMARHIAEAILSQSYVAGNGGFSSQFGPITYDKLLLLATNGNKEDYCIKNGHLYNYVDRCVICNHNRMIL